MKVDQMILVYRNRSYNARGVIGERRRIIVKQLAISVHAIAILRESEH